MKLTWFGGTTLRIQIGGTIFVCDPEGAPAGIDRTELVSAADRTFSLADALPAADPLRWQPRRPGALIDAPAETPEVELHSLGQGAALVDAVGEPPLLLLAAPSVPAGRWSHDAVVVAFSAGIAARALDTLAPRLMAIAAPEADVDAAFATLSDRLASTALVALEPGLALEV